VHRRFYLENEQSQRYNLQDLKNAALLISPSGLGLTMARSYELTGDSARSVNEDFPARSFTGTIVFDASHAYDGYRQLVNFIAGSENIILVYTPRYETVNNEYLADVGVENLSKSEIKGGRMECDISITLKGAWFKRESLRVVAEKTGSELRYDRLYDFVYSDVSTDNIEIFNDGHFEAPILLEAEGELVNPRLSLFVNRVLRSELTIAAVIERGEVLVFCTKDDDLTLKKMLPDGSELSLIGSISLQNENFFKLPRGLSTLSLAADNDIASKSTLTVFMSYKAV
jgi:hypothetical protein